MIEPEDVQKSWNPYVAGILTGILLIASAWIANKYIGASTTYVRTAGMIERVFAAPHVDSLAYYQKEEPKIEWQWMFLFGLGVGALLSSAISGTFRWKGIPDMWAAHFGTSIPKRAAFAFVGGIIMIIGARMAGGCTSGHGISGVLQLASSGIVTAVSLFAAAVAAAHLLYRGGAR